MHGLRRKAAHIRRKRSAERGGPTVMNMMDVRVRAERAGASLQDAFLLLEVSSQLSRTHDVQAIARQVCSVARRLVGMDGTTFVLREGEQVYYAEEDAPERLWRGRRFPAVQCISGWAILNRRTAVIEDIYTDPRIPIEAYRPTFVKSLAMVPMGREQPLGSIGAYWARRHKATERKGSASSSRSVGAGRGAGARWGWASSS
jgi:hypothetical protein